MRFPRIPRTGLGLRDVFKESYFASPYQAIQNQDATPFESLLRRSQGLDLARQYLPRALGGYGKAKMNAFDEARRTNPRVRERSLRVGEYPSLDGQTKADQGIAAEAARRLAQGAGAVAADVTTQGALNIWWFINAAEAAAMAGGQQAMHGALGKQRLLRRPAVPGAEGYTGAPFKMSATKVAAAFPLIVGAGAATGSLFRQPGYAAVLPSEEDRTKSDDPVTERLLRTIGRTGSLLPFEQFSQERPDVSRSEYEAYKAFLHGNKSPVKFTDEGIHGPEVNFLGKSIPVLTGLAPVVGGIIGGRAGVRMAGKRLAGVNGGTNEFQRLSTLDANVERLRASKSPQARIRLESAEKAAKQQLYRVEGGLLGGAIAGTSAGLGITAAGSQLLEQMRRAANAEENRRQAESEIALPG